MFEIAFWHTHSIDQSNCTGQIKPESTESSYLDSFGTGKQGTGDWQSWKACYDNVSMGQKYRGHGVLSACVCAYSCNTH